MKPSCLMPWHALTLAGNGDIKPCCQLRGSHPNVHQGKDIVESMRSAEIRQLRRRLLANERPEACSSCWQREAGIGQSRRTWFRNKFESSVPEGFQYSESADSAIVQADLSLSNFCNLKCRMCGSWGSHQWVKEDLALQKISSEFKRETRPEQLRLLETEVERIEGLVPHLKFAKRIDFKGGEPMLAKGHPELLELLIRNGLQSQLSLTYTSNGTVVNPLILKMLKEFKSVTIIFSIEAIGPLYQYIRGGKFTVEDLTRNIRVYDQLENISLGFNVATQVYNITRLKELCDFLFSLDLKRGSPVDAFKYTLVNSPAYLSPFILPEVLRSRAIDSIEGEPELKHIFEKLRATSFDQELWSTFVKFTDALDGMRRESIREVLPEFGPHWQR